MLLKKNSFQYKTMDIFVCIFCAIFIRISALRGGLSDTLIKGHSTPNNIPVTTHCKGGWYGHEGNCYKFVYDSPRTADDARKYCNDILRDAHLVSMNTVQEFRFVTTKIVSLAGANGYKIGTHEYWWSSRMIDRNGNWYWNNKDKDCTEYFRVAGLWSRGQPNNSGGSEDYIIMILSNGDWGLHDFQGDSKHRFVCEVKGSIKPSNSCPLGWTENEDSCYRFVIGVNAISHDAASIACRRLNGRAHLVYVNDRREATYLINYYEAHLNRRPLPREAIWAGGEEDKNGIFKWFDKSVKFDSTLWRAGEPSNSNGLEDRVGFWYWDNKFGGLNDFPNNYPTAKSYICELERKVIG